jgi:capping protein (actin filament) muscle Z-line, beta
VNALKEMMTGNPDAAESLSKKYQLPFQVLDAPVTATDDNNGERPFLLCRYNRVGDKHRSPWTNKLYPGGDEVDTKEPDDLRLFEDKVNQVWNSYMNLYYGHAAVGSVYLSEWDKGAFQGVFGIQKKCSSGSWNSIHFVHVNNPEEKTCKYRVESLVLVVLEPDIDGKGETSKLDISASLSKETSKDCKIQQTMLAASHIENIGMLIEANEIDLRSSLERVHVPKTQEIVDSIQKDEPKMHTRVNPLMGMIMDSDLLKKKLAKSGGE